MESACIDDIQSTLPQQCLMDVLMTRRVLLARLGMACPVTSGQVRRVSRCVYNDVPVWYVFICKDAMHGPYRVGLVSCIPPPPGTLPLSNQGCQAEAGSEMDKTQIQHSGSIHFPAVWPIRLDNDR